MREAFKTNSVILFNEDDKLCQKAASVTALHSQMENYQTVDQ